MNAHINLDLGIAAAQTAPGDAIHGLKNDFYSINIILNSLVDEIRNDIENLSPRLAKVVKYMVFEDKMMQLGIKIARYDAWKFATSLAVLPPEKWADAIKSRDQITTKIGRILVDAGWLENVLVWWVKRKESRDLPFIIRDLRRNANAKVRFPSSSKDQKNEEIKKV